MDVRPEDRILATGPAVDPSSSTPTGLCFFQRRIAAQISGETGTTRLARLCGAAALVATLVLVVGGTANAATAEAAKPDRAELESFVDAFVPRQLEEYDAPGAVVVVVSHGEVLLRKGYGHTDLERRTPVDPQRTRFDIGSVTKLFTATAVMQLVEQGRLDLDADVNRYLSDLQVPETFAEPITAAHLLTHTAGFEERLFVGMVARTPAEVGPLGENLARHLPPRIRPPGTVHQYSNHGIALAGHVIEEISGRPFDRYVAAEILSPLGMTRTTWGEQPGPPAEDAVGHEDTTGTTAAVDPVYTSTRPDGGLWSTADDMAAFMLAHLEGGEHDGARILQAATVEEMQRTHFRSHPAVSGIGYGFFELQREGGRAVQHGGGWIGFGSMLRLLPEERFGLFVAYNHGRGQQLGPELADGVADELFPAPASGREPAVRAAADTEAFTGDYHWIRRDRHTYMSLLSALTTTRFTVTSNGDGTLGTTMWPWKLIDDARWVEKEPGVFREAGGTKTLAFDLDENGRPTRLHVDGPQLFVMEPAGWHERASVTLGLLAFFALTLVVAAAAWPIGHLYRRIRRRTAAAPPNLRRVRRLTGLAGIAGLAFFLGFVLHFALDQVGLLNVSLAFRALLLLPLLAAALAIAAAVSVGQLWMRGGSAIAARVYHSAVVAALLALIPYLYYWRLLGFHY